MSDIKTDFWHYSRRERKATILLCLLAITLFLLPAVYRHLPRKPDPETLASFREAIICFEAAQKDSSALTLPSALFFFDPNKVSYEQLTALGLSSATARTIIKYRDKGGTFRRAEDLARIYNLDPEDFERIRPYIRIGQFAAKEKPGTHLTAAPPEPFAFDPNTVGLEELKRLGLPERAAENLVRYRRAGGRFYRPEDLQKIYGLSVRDFLRLKDFILIRDSSEQMGSPLASAEEVADSAFHTRPATTRPVAASITIDINLASAGEWRQLRGIGPVLSERIVKFRDKMGGFTHIDQVAETYGLADTAFQAIRSQLRFSPPHRSIAINSADAHQLQQHPYISRQQARVIVAYRDEHGPYRGLEDLRKVRALKEELIQKMAPYLQFE